MYLKGENEMAKLNRKQCEALAMDIFKWLLEHEMWQDVRIYFNGKAIGTYNPETGEYCYNENRYFTIDDIDPKDYFEYVNEDHMLSMSFEGPLYELLNGYIDCRELTDEFMELFNKYGVYYELGNAWNLSVYE